MKPETVGPYTGRSRVSAWSVVFLVVAVALLAIGFVYFTTTSARLPAFLPGHYERSRLPGLIAQARKHHLRLGLLSFGLVCEHCCQFWGSPGSCGSRRWCEPVDGSRSPYQPVRSSSRRSTLTQHTGTVASEAGSSNTQNARLDVGVSALSLHVVTTNPAIRLYERNGYRTTMTATDPRYEQRTGIAGRTLMVKDLTQ